MYLTRPSSLYPVLGLSYNIFSLLQSLYRAIVVCKKWDNFFSFPFWTCILIRISLTLLQLELNFSFSFAGTVIGSSCTSPNQFIGIFAPIISSECYLLLPIKKNTHTHTQLRAYFHFIYNCVTFHSFGHPLLLCSSYYDYVIGW